MHNRRWLSESYFCATILWKERHRRGTEKLIIEKENEIEIRLKVIKSNNGGEFVGKKLKRMVGRKKYKATIAHMKNIIKYSKYDRTPYEQWKERKPNISYIRRFRCVSYLLDTEGIKRKFKSKTTKGILVDYIIK